MKNMTNAITVEGRVYDFSKLKIRTAGENAKAPGTIFINGMMEIATDEEGCNVIPYYVTYCTAKTSKGNVNNTFTELKNIIENGKSWIEHGKDEATVVRVNASLELNDFYTEDNQLVSQKRVGGGFVKIIAAKDLNPDESKRAMFELDVLFNNAVEVEANEEKEIPAYVKLHGAAFNYKKVMLPIDLSIENPNGMKYFLDACPSNAELLFTKVWGSIISRNTTRAVKTESAFGESFVKMVPTSQKKWLITGANTIPYVYDDESTITTEEFKKAASDREVYLAEVKARQEEYKNAQSNAAPAASVAKAPAAAGGFNF